MDVDAEEDKTGDKKLLYMDVEFKVDEDKRPLYVDVDKKMVDVEVDKNRKLLIVDLCEAAEDVDEDKKMVEVDKDTKLLNVDVDVEEAKGRRIWLCAAGLSSLPTCQHLGSDKDEDGAAFIIRLVALIAAAQKDTFLAKIQRSKIFAGIGDLWGLISDQSKMVGQHSLSDYQIIR